MLAAQAGRECPVCPPGLDGAHGCAAQAAAGSHAVGLHSQPGEHLGVPGKLKPICVPMDVFEARRAGGSVRCRLLPVLVLWPSGWARDVMTLQSWCSC